MADRMFAFSAHSVKYKTGEKKLEHYSIVLHYGDKIRYLLGNFASFIANLIMYIARVCTPPYLP